MFTRQLSRSVAAQSRSLATHAPSTVVANVVARSPRISRTPTAFEKSFYEYQQRIARSLHNPFPHEFYFKQGAPLESQFNIEERKREKDAFGSVSQFMMDVTEANLEAAELAKEEIEPPAPRTAEADKTNDLHSLDRQGERNLYLLLKKEDGTWTFPQRQVQKGELMHQAAERVLYPEVGINIDTWMVSRKPIGVYQPTSSESQPDTTFFYKFHVLAGQVKPNGTSSLDFAWLTKEEISKYVDGQYWDGVKDMLSDF